tara:strand:- start:11849 stop:12769 length:921 start_codon:yes stop_codon:yes gene_type:complete
MAFQTMKTTTTQLGQVKISRIIESSEPLLRPAEIFPDSDPDIIARNIDWLAPHFYDPETDKLVITIQSFLLETQTHKILIDTCVGDCKQRVRSEFHEKQWNWLKGLESLGLGVEDIDIVLSTHMHVDHVGWNTRFNGKEWVPTFPNARYLFTAPEWDYWKENEGHPALVRSGDYIGDSVWPLFHAGQADLVNMDHEIVPGVRLVPLPGHTPGHVGVEIDNASDPTLITADLFHHPLQCCYPHWNTRFCLDPLKSRATRLNAMADLAHKGTTVMAAHFPSPNAGKIEVVKHNEPDAARGHVYRYRFI